MKLVFAIINSDDESRLLDSLSSNNFRITRLCSTGGFLKTGNITLMSAVEDQRVSLLIELVNRNCKSRKQFLDDTTGPKTDMDYSITHPSMASLNYTNTYSPSRINDIVSQYNVEVVVGGAIIFVLNVERFVKM